MELRKFISITIREFLSEQKVLKESVSNINKILDKINKHGQASLSYDEKMYLQQYSNKNINTDLENWLFSDDENTFDSDGKKLLFDEFENDEDIFHNYEKLKRIISKHLNKKPFTNNADWGNGYVWSLKSINDFTGVFLYLGDDDDLVVIKRTLTDDEYDDEEIKNITNSRELYSFLISLKNN